MAVKPIPEGYHTVTPYLLVKDANAAIEFYRQAFGAEELMRMEHGDRVGHAEIQIGDSRIMLADEVPEMGFRSPDSLGGSPVSIVLYVEDVDAVFSRSIDAGGRTIKPLADQFYGDRSGTFVDPFGHVWTVATHIEDVSQEEMERRMKAMGDQGGQDGA